LTLSAIWLFGGGNNVIVAKKVKEGLFYTIFRGHTEFCRELNKITKKKNGLDIITFLGHPVCMFAVIFLSQVISIPR